MAKIGDERYLLEIISIDPYETLARERGWDGNEGLRDYVEPEEVATYKSFKTLIQAEIAAKKFLDTGKSAFGCCLIDREIYEKEYHDVPPDWQRQQTWEVATDGETIDVNRW